MKIRMLVVALAAVLVAGSAPGTGAASPAHPAADAPPAPAKAYRIWYSDFGSAVDGMALDPVTGRAFVRQDATSAGAALMVAGPGTYYEPDRLDGPYGYPVAAGGSIFVFRAGQLRRINPTTLVETGSWTVPDLAVDKTLATVDGDIVWAVPTGAGQGYQRLYRFDPDTGTTASSTETNLGYDGPVGGGDELVGWAQYPARLIRFTGAQPGDAIDPGSGQHEINNVDVSDDGALVTAVDFPEHRAVEYSLPGLEPTGTVYQTAPYPMRAASTTAAGGAVAVVSAGVTGHDFSLQVFARGNPNPLVDVDLPPARHVPRIGDLEFSADGKRLFFLVSDVASSNVVARLVVADLASTINDEVDPPVVGSRGGATVSLFASLGPGTTVELDGQPIDATINASPFETQGATNDQITFTVPAMTPGAKSLVLTNPLGQETTARPLQVVDLGPFVNAPWFVKKQISDITGSKASTHEIDEVLKLIAAGQTPGEFIAALEVNRRQSTTSAALIRLYRAVFLRPPDTAGLSYWLGRMEGGTRLVQVAATFAGSNEFKNRYGSLSDGAFVDRIYRNVLGRPADPSGRAYWIAKLRAGTSRGVLVAQFAQSNEYVTKSTGDVQRIELRLAMLHKTPTEAQLAPLRAMDLDDVAWLFLNDPNYQTA